MKKSYALLSALLVIALISGGYALFNGDGIADTPNADVSANPLSENAPTASVSEITPVKENSDPITVISEIIRQSPIANTTAKYVLSVNGKDYVNSAQDFTDKYCQCVECGGFVALGEVTKEIPQSKKCTCDDELAGVGHLNADDYYVYSYEEVMYYISHGDFPDSVNERRNAYEQNIKATIAEIITHYNAVPGYEDTFVNGMQDFTDKYVKCCECGKYIPLGDTTNSLPEEMICNHTTRGHSIAYLDTNIWGVMDYSKVLEDANSNQTSKYPAELEDTNCKTFCTSTNMESSLIARQDFDMVIYTTGLWGEEINEYTVFFNSASNIEVSDAQEFYKPELTLIYS